MEVYVFFVNTYINMKSVFEGSENKTTEMAQTPRASSQQQQAAEAAGAKTLHRDHSPGAPAGPSEPASRSPCAGSDRPGESARHARAVSEPCEAGGMTMTELAAVMRLDAKQQKHLVDVLGRVLDVTVARNDAANLGASMLMSFESTRRCPLKPSRYLARIQEYTAASPCNFAIGLIYLQRLRDSDPAQGMRLTSLNTQRCLLTAIMLAAKTYDDLYVSNKQWAAVGDLAVAEMNTLELDMLFALEFSMKVTREEYDQCVRALENLDAAFAEQAADAPPLSPPAHTPAHPRTTLKPLDTTHARKTTHAAADTHVADSDTQPGGPASPGMGVYCQGSRGSSVRLAV